jgi:hypothetical protein
MGTLTHPFLPPGSVAHVSIPAPLSTLYQKALPKMGRSE